MDFVFIYGKKELVIVPVSRHQVDKIGNFSKNECVKLAVLHYNKS